MPTTCTTKGTDRKVFTIRTTAILLVLLTLVLAKPMVGQSAVESSSDRKILSHIEPTYPETLKRLVYWGRGASEDWRGSERKRGKCGIAWWQSDLGSGSNESD
jgi:hypothetical protein